MKKANRNEMRKRVELFTEMYIESDGDLRKISKALGITRQEAKRLRKKYFPQMSNRRQLFTKLMLKQDLNILELKYLLRVKRATLLGYKKRFKVAGEL